MSVVNLAQVMLWGIDDEDHVWLSMYSVRGMYQGVNATTKLEAMLIWNIVRTEEL